MRPMVLVESMMSERGREWRGECFKGGGRVEKGEDAAEGGGEGEREGGEGQLSLQAKER